LASVVLPSIREPLKNTVESGRSFNPLSSDYNRRIGSAYHQTVHSTVLITPMTSRVAKLCENTATFSPFAIANRKIFTRTVIWRERFCFN
jgi:hypothetical protein